MYSLFQLSSIMCSSGTSLSKDEQRDLGESMLWKVDLGWSREAGALRDIAVMAGEKLTPQQVKETIRSLRIVDKQVCVEGKYILTGTCTCTCRLQLLCVLQALSMETWECLQV